MNKKLQTLIKIATAVLASAVVICFATPHIAGSDSKTAHGADFPVQAAVVTTLPETTATVTTGATTTTTSFTSTSTKTPEITTTVVTEESASVEIPVEPTEAEIQPVEPQREYVVFKPSTHYIHKSTCHWADDTCDEITDTKEIECRKCSECNPEIEIVNEYIEPTPVAVGIDDYSRRLLAEITQREAGSNWISQYNKAKIVAGVMNRVSDPRFSNTVYDVLVAPSQFSGYWPGCCEPSQACWDAVDYYFNHTDEFNSDNSWWGDGSQNHFYYQ